MGHQTSISLFMLIIAVCLWYTMGMDLSPKFPLSFFEGEGGSYYTWSVSDFALLSETQVGAGKLVLQPQGFVFPHYADCPKVGYVLEGDQGTVGMILPNISKEMILSLKKGDVLPVPSGAISWWYNSGESELVIIYLFETSKAYIPGEITYFLLTGGQGILSGFSTEFISRAYNMNEVEANKLAKSQTGDLIIKRDQEDALSMSQPHEDIVRVKNVDEIFPDINVKNAGIANTFTGDNFPFLEDVGLSTNSLKLDANAMLSPIYTSDSTVQLIYVAKGFGKVQIVGLSGKLVLDTNVEAGQLFVVPRFFVVAMIAGGEGMECFSIITSTQPHVEEFAGKNSVLNAISPKALQVSLGVTPEDVLSFKSKIGNSEVLMPPMN